MNANGLLVEFALVVRDIELVFVLEFDIRSGTIENSLEVNGESQLRAVKFHAIKHTTTEESGLDRAISHSDKLANGMQVVAQTILSRTEDCTIDANRVLQAIEDGFHVYGIRIHHRKFLKLVVFNGHNRTSAIVTCNTNGSRICFSREAACVIDKLRERFAFFELVGHRTTYIARDGNVLCILIHDNHIAIFQSDIVFLTAHQVGVEVDRSNLLAVAEHFDITKRTGIGDTACHVKSMENGSKRRELIRTRYANFTHDVDLDRTRLPKRNHELAALITRTVGRFDSAGSFLNRQSCQFNWTIIFEGNHALRRDGFLHLQLAGTIDIDDNFITSPQPIVLRGGNVHLRLKAETMRAENIGTIQSRTFVNRKSRSRFARLLTFFGRFSRDVGLHIFRNFTYFASRLLGFKSRFNTLELLHRCPLSHQFLGDSSGFLSLLVHCFSELNNSFIRNGIHGH